MCKMEIPLENFYKRKDGYKDLYRSDCKSCSAKKAAKRYEANPEKWHIRDKAWRTANLDKEKARGKRYRETHKKEWSQKTLEWQRKNKEAHFKSVKEYNQRYPERINALTAKRKAAKVQRTPKWLTKDHLAKIQSFYRHASLLTKQTGIQHHVDHIVPLRGKIVSGLHVPWNLKVITAIENHRKSNKVKEQEF